MNIQSLHRVALSIAALALASCAEVPGGITCLMLFPVESVNRSPITDVVTTAIKDGRRSAPLYAVGESKIDTLGFGCAGTVEFELAHPRYQTTTVRYTSPRDRTLSGNSLSENLVVVMTAR
jgi:hypothetical protein